MSHEQIGDLVNYGVVAMLDMAVLGQRQSGHLILEPWSPWCFGGSLEVYETHVHAAVPTWLCRHRRIGP